MTDNLISNRGTIITTGTGAGIGTSIALKLISVSQPGIQNIFTVRPSQDTASPTYVALKQAISNSTDPSHHEITQLSLEDFSNVRAFAASINEKVKSGALPRIKVLILNAGVQNTRDLQITKDGFELASQVNYLANVLLISLLLPSFAGIDSHDTAPGRILFISSDSHDPERARAFPALHWPSKDEEFADLFRPNSIPPGTSQHEFGMGRYALSKLCLAMYMFSLQRYLDADPMYSSLETLSVDPGWVATNLLRTNGPITRYGIVTFLKLGPYVRGFFGTTGKQFHTADDSAEYVIKYAIGDLKGEKPKAWYIIQGEKANAGELARDESKQESLWSKTVAILGSDAENGPGLSLKTPL